MDFGSMHLKVSSWLLDPWDWRLSLWFCFSRTRFRPVRRYWCQYQQTENGTGLICVVILKAISV